MSVMFLIFRLLVWLSQCSELVNVRVYRHLMAIGQSLDNRRPYWVRKRLLNGAELKLDLSEKTQRGIYAAHIYEPGSTRFLVRTLIPGDLFVDVGANVGYFSALAQAAGAEVLALEPEARNYAQLKQLEQVTSLRVACGAADGDITLYVNPHNRGGNTVLTKLWFLSSESQKVPLCRLDTLVKKSTRLVKIDVEGFELSVLHGMSGLLAEQSVEYVLCEIRVKREDCFAFLKRYGYRPYGLDKSGHLVEQFGRNVVFAIPK